MFNLAKTIFFVLTIFAVSATVSFSQNDNMKSGNDNMKSEHESMKSDEPVGKQLDGGILYGQEYDQGMTAVSYSEFIASPESSNGKTVLLKGNVSEVCQAMGCWMTMSDGVNSTRVKTGHEFFLPKDIAGRDAVVYGVFKISEISEEDAKHYAEESKDPSVKPEDIKGPQKAFEIDATGILILNPSDSPAKN